MRITTKLTAFLMVSAISPLSGAAEFIYFDKLSEKFDDFIYFDQLSEKFDEVGLRPVIGATGGLAFAKVNASANYTAGFTNFDYDSHQDVQTRGVWGAFLGAELDWNRDWDWQTTVSYYQTSPFSSEGYLTQDADEFTPDVFKYSFKVRTYQILWENKWLVEWRERYYPYVSVGIGAAINKAEDYKTNANPVVSLTPDYKDKTNTSFSYSFGVGMDYEILPDCLRLGLGYRFTDLGKAGVEKAYMAGTEFDHSIQTNHLYNQELILQLTYLIP